ncbi:PEP-utilizing enzyme, partial [Elusimicrobiota bacterium]
IEQLRSKIEKFNTLIDANFAALELIFENSKTLTPKVVEAILGHLETMVEGYLAMQPAVMSEWDFSGLLSGLPVKEKLTSLKTGLENSLSSFGPNDIVPKTISSMVTGFESADFLTDVKTVHELINYVHQNSFKLLETVTQKISSDFIYLNELKVFNANEEPWFEENGRVSSPLMRSVLLWPESDSDGRIILMDNSLWAHIKMGDHSAGIYVDPSSPDEGGMFRISYAEGEANQDPNWRAIRIGFVEHLLKGLGMRVTVLGDNEFVQAVLDKDSGIKTGEEILSVFHTAMCALNSTFNLDDYIERSDEIEGDLGLEKHIEIAREWADIFIAENNFPFLEYGGPSYKVYLKYEKEMEKMKLPLLREALNKELVKLQMPQIPENQRMGQQVIDTYFNKPIQLGLEREEFVMIKETAYRNPDYRQELFSVILNYIQGYEEESIQLGTVVSQLEGIINFETIGGMGRYLVQRSALRLGDGLLDIYTLRDVDSNKIYYASVFEVKELENKYSRTQSDAHAVQKVLERELYETGPPLAVTQAQRQIASQKLQADPYNSILGNRVLGLASSRGNGKLVSGPVTYLDKHSKKESKIFIAPFTTPDDVKAIKNSRGVITTGGGILAHAGITTREFGVPSVILPSARWIEKDGGKTVVLDLFTPKDYSKSPEGIWISNTVETREIPVREGDVLSIDGLTGAVMPVGREFQSEVQEARELFEKLRKKLPSKLERKFRTYSTSFLDALQMLQRLTRTTESFDIIRFIANQTFLTDMGESNVPDLNIKEAILESILANEKFTGDWLQFQNQLLNTQSEKAWDIMEGCMESMFTASLIPAFCNLLSINKLLILASFRSIVLSPPPTFE